MRADLVELLRLAGPVVMARLGIMVMGLTDAIIVGRYSAEELGFHALGWAPTSVIVTTAVGLLLGVQVMTARLVGEGRQLLHRCISLPAERLARGRGCLRRRLPRR